MMDAGWMALRVLLQAKQRAESLLSGSRIEATLDHRVSNQPTHPMRAKAKGKGVVARECVDMADATQLCFASYSDIFDMGGCKTPAASSPQRSAAPWAALLGVGSPSSRRAERGAGEASRHELELSRHDRPSPFHSARLTGGEETEHDMRPGRAGLVSARPPAPVVVGGPGLDQTQPHGRPGDAAGRERLTQLLALEWDNECSARLFRTGVAGCAPPRPAAPRCALPPAACRTARPRCSSSRPDNKLRRTQSVSRCR